MLSIKVNQEISLHLLNFLITQTQKMGQLVGSDAEKAMLRLNDTNFKLMPSVTPPFNGINDEYIYTTKGGWIDMVHFLFYASEAYSYKKEMMENPSTSYLGLTQQEIVSKSINHAVKCGYLQEKLDSIKPLILRIHMKIYPPITMGRYLVQIILTQNQK